MSYYMLLVVAGNETTRNSIAHGMVAFTENPAQLFRSIYAKVYEPFDLSNHCRRYMPGVNRQSQTGP